MSPCLLHWILRLILSPVFIDEETELAQGYMGKWQNYSDYKTCALYCHIMLRLPVQWPATWSFLTWKTDWQNLWNKWLPDTTEFVTISDSCQLFVRIFTLSILEYGLNMLVNYF